MKALERLEVRFARIHQLNATAGWLHWDLGVCMPPGSTAARGRQIAAQEEVIHELLTARQVADDIEAARVEGDLDAVEAANLLEIERRHRRAVTVPAKLVAAQARANTACVRTWENARPLNDWHSVIAPLKEVLSLCRERASALRTLGFNSDYDALLDDFDPGLTRARIDGLFNPIKARVPELVRHAVTAQKQSPPLPPSVPRGGFPKAEQQALVHEIARLLGFDAEHGRIDESHHPFTVGVKEDVRITTRYLDWIETFMATVHEVGHALYVLGLPSEPAGQPVSEDCGMSVHESQSLFFERFIGRSDAFVRCVTPLLHLHLQGGPSDAPEWQPENLARVLRVVKPQPIRVRADEATYGLHIIQRYELETALLDGDLEVEDLPSAWNEKLRDLLGVPAPDMADGVLQDTHWFTGLIGYFPTYLIGALMAAQLHAAASRELDIDGCVSGETLRAAGGLAEGQRALARAKQDGCRAHRRSNRRGAEHCGVPEPP